MCRARLILRLLLCTRGCKYSTPALMNACADFFLRCSTRPRLSSKIFGGASRECDSCSKKPFGLLFGLKENFLLLRLSFFNFLILFLQLQGCQEDAGVIPWFQSQKNRPSGRGG